MIARIRNGSVTDQVVGRGGKVAIGAGHFYAYRLREALGIDPGYGVVRAAMVHDNSEEEADRLIRPWTR